MSGGDRFEETLARMEREHQALLERPNERIGSEGALIERYRHPVLTGAHTPLFWRYDLDPSSNPRLLERMGINSVFNPGAISYDGRYVMMARVEGWDRKSFFAVAESETGVDRWRFRDYPIRMPETDDPDVNVYDMRLTRHEDGWIYGVFCTERKDPESPDDPTAAVA
ncbi:MAG: glycosidase, partial [Gemmatimonadota bacterium]